MDYKEYQENLEKKHHAEISRLAKLNGKGIAINPKLYQKYDVKRGLRDINGNGVVCGLTEISEIISFKKDDKGEKAPCKGELYYRGYNVSDLVDGFIQRKRYGFEETAYLLLFGKLPSAEDLKNFSDMLCDYRLLPTNFVRDIIMKSPSRDMMNMLARCVLNLYSYDRQAEKVSVSNVLRQSLQLIARFPLLTVYSNNAYKYYNTECSLYIHKPDPSLSTAENLLYILRDDNKFTELEAMVLDICLILHAEHGGGNNSTFTTHVVSSSGTDTYSSVAASLGSLKGPKHGGANVKVVQMFDNIKENVHGFTDGNLRDYLIKMLDKEVFDKSGLIYGMGHAVYSLSDPRCDILKDCAMKLAAEKNMTEEFELHTRVAKIAGELIAERRKIYKGVSPNVDFYSGLIYDMLKLDRELYTPLFAVSRIAGWSAHRLEEIASGGKIIRPSYISISGQKKYVPIDERN